MSTPAATFHVLAKRTGAIWNLDCKYCFFLSREALYPGDKFRMQDDVLENFIRQQLASQGQHATIAWQNAKLAGTPLRSNTTAMCIRAITSSSRSIWSGILPTQHWRSSSDHPRQRTFGNAKRDTLPRFCRECEVSFACHGESPKNRFTTTPDGEHGLNYLCAGYKAFFTHIDRPMQVMANLLRQGRFADEAMAMLNAEAAQRAHTVTA